MCHRIHDLLFPTMKGVGQACHFALPCGGSFCDSYVCLKVLRKTSFRFTFFAKGDVVGLNSWEHSLMLIFNLKNRNFLPAPVGYRLSWKTI